VNRSFVGEAVEPRGGFDTAPMGQGEPGLPAAFRWRNEELIVRGVRRAWRSTKEDRGDVYLKRHYFELELADSRVATVYFERQAKRNAPRWYLYTIAST
jgi:uncharacterized protein DUF6504